MPRSSPSPQPDPQRPEPPNAESSPSELPKAPPPQLSFDALTEWVLERCRVDVPPSLEALARLFPHFRDEIETLLPVVLELEGHAQARSDRSDRSSPAANEPESSHGSAPPIATPRTVGEFEIIREIGRGGMGVVLEARQPSLDRHVALKVLPPQAVLDPRLRQRFEVEARAAAGLHHPHIVPVYGVGESEGIHHFAMQFIEGSTLDECLETLRQGQQVEPLGLHPQSSDRTQLNGLGKSAQSTLPQIYRNLAKIARDVASALAYAHDQGILHRDIKPSNLILDPSGHVWVTDFGLAKVEEGHHLTQTGDIVGTPRYMAPELLHGQSDARTDVFSLGTTLYELLTLKPAFDHRDRQRLIIALEHEDPAPPRKLDPRIPVDLDTIVRTAIRKDPRDRYSSAAAFAADLDRFLNRQPIAARPASWTYRTRLFVRRNAVAVSVASAIAVATVVATIAWVVSIDHERRRAITARSLAEDNLDLALDSIREVLTDFSTQDLARFPQLIELERSLYSRAATLYDELLLKNPESTGLRAEAARASLRLAAVFEAQTRFQEALHAIDHGTQHLDAATRDRYPQLIALLGAARGQVFNSLGDVESADRAFSPIRSWYDELPIPRSPGERYEMIGALRRLAEFESDQSRTDASVRAAEALLLLLAPLEKESAPTVGRATTLVPIYRGLADVFMASHEYDRCIEYSHRGIQAFEVIREAGRETTYDKSGYASLASKIAVSYGAQGNYERSEDYSLRSLATLQDLIATSGDPVTYYHDRAALLQTHAHQLRSQGRIRENIEFLIQARDDFFEVRRSRNLTHNDRSNLAVLHDQLGLSYRRVGQYEDAEKAQRAALKEVSSLDLERHLTARLLQARFRSNLGITLNRLKRADEAREIYRLALAELERDREAVDALHYRSLVLSNWGSLERRQRRFTEAASILEEAVTAAEALHRSRPEEVSFVSGLAAVQSSLGNTYASLNRAEEARVQLDKAVSTGELALALNPNSARLRSVLGGNLNNLAGHRLREDPEECVSLCLRAVEHQSFALHANPENRIYRTFLANHRRYLMRGLIALERWNDALATVTDLRADEPQDVKNAKKRALLCTNTLKLCIDRNASEPIRDRWLQVSLTAIEDAVGRGLDRSALDDPKLAPLSGQPRFDALKNSERGGGDRDDTP